MVNGKYNITITESTDESSESKNASENNPIAQRLFKEVFDSDIKLKKKSTKTRSRRRVFSSKQ